MNTDHRIDEKATLFFGLALLLFVQLVTVWIDSIYNMGLIKTSPGKEMAGLAFLVLPLLMPLIPEDWHRKALTGALAVFFVARAIVPLVGASAGILIAGAGVGCFLIALCFILSRPFRFLQGNSGIAVGLAVAGSIVLRSWGASVDMTLAISGALLGWLLIGLAAGLYWQVMAATDDDATSGNAPWYAAYGPVLGLFCSITAIYLVLSSPAVIAAWLGFDNTYGVVVLLLVWGTALVLIVGFVKMQSAGTRLILMIWNVLFFTLLIAGILALRVNLVDHPDDPVLVVAPENLAAQIWLNLMFVLSPVLLFNVWSACRSLHEIENSRVLSVPVFGGMVLLMAVTIMSIFTNVWGYVGDLSAGLRNQFQVPFVVLGVLMLGALLLPGWTWGFPFFTAPRNKSRLLSMVTLVLVVAGIAGTLTYGPVSTSPDSARKELTILTYNHQQGASLEGNRNWEQQLAFIRAVDPDIIGLQESDTARPSGGHVNAAKYFGAKLGYHVYYGPNTVSGTYGTAVLSRFPIKNAYTFFTYGNIDEVGTAVIEIEVDGKTMAFFNSHPAGSQPRLRHTHALLEQIEAYEYVIAVGDYNSRPSAAPYQLIAEKLTDSWIALYPNAIGRLHPTLRPQENTAERHKSSSGQVSESAETINMARRIDHIFLSPQFRVLEDYFLPTPASQTDHPAHWSIITWD